jgi:hypothetical protein
LEPQERDMPLTRLVDLIPNSDSAETVQNSEPSLGVNPLDATQMVAGIFGSSGASYFKSTKKTRAVRRVTRSILTLPPQLANAVGVISSEERF